MRRGWKIKDGHIRDKMRILDQNEKGVENKGGLGVIGSTKKRGGIGRTEWVTTLVYRWRV
jgi:hypothetical protein